MPGVIDGKHVSIIQPLKSGNLYFNYKKFFSIVPLADANYKFLFVDIGREGSTGDTQIFNHTGLKAYIETDQLCWSKPELLPKEASTGMETSCLGPGEEAGVSMEIIICLVATMAPMKQSS